jgi:hypothetical protein
LSENGTFPYPVTRIEDFKIGHFRKKAFLLLQIILLPDQIQHLIRQRPNHLLRLIDIWVNSQHLQAFWFFDSQAWIIREIPFYEKKVGLTVF